MFLNSGGWLGGNSSGGSGNGEGNTTIIQGSSNYTVNSISDMNAISKPPSNSIAYVLNNKETYIYTKNDWILTSKLTTDELIAIQLELDKLKLDLDNKADVDSIPKWESFNI